MRRDDPAESKSPTLSDLQAHVERFFRSLEVEFRDRFVIVAERMSGTAAILQWRAATFGTRAPASEVHEARYDWRDDAVNG